MACVSASQKERYETTLECSTEVKTVCFLSTCVQQRHVSSGVFPRGAPLEGSHTYVDTHTHTHSSPQTQTSLQWCLVNIAPKVQI